MNHKFMKQKKWNPINRANLEDKWKREQALEKQKQIEADRAKKLQQERSIMQFEEQIQNGKNGQDELAWMYRLIPDSTTVQNDQMLGKREIDLNSKEEKLIPGSTIAEDSLATSTSEAYRRVNEDPLLAIEKSEMEIRKRLLSNPQSIRKIKQLLAQRKGVPYIEEPEKPSYRDRSSSRDRSNSNHRSSDRHRHHRHRSPDRHSSYSRSSYSSRHRRERDEGYSHSNRSSRSSKSFQSMTEEEKQRKLEEMRMDAQTNEKYKTARLLTGRKNEEEDRLEQKEHKEDFHFNPKFIQQFKKEAYMGTN